MHLTNENDDMKKKMEVEERKKRVMDVEMSEILETSDDLKRSNESLSSLKIKLETALELINVRCCSLKLNLNHTKYNYYRLIMMSRVCTLELLMKKIQNILRK